MMEKGVPEATLCTIIALVFFASGLFIKPLSAQQKGLAHDDLFSVSSSMGVNGWACGRYGTILHTADSGKTWTRQDSGTTYTLISIHFIDSKNGWAVGNGGTIVHTSDGGKTWETQKSPVDYFHTDVHFLTPLRGFVISERSHILSTNDGGKTWMIQFKDGDRVLKAISFCDERHGWTVGEYGYIYYTSDGGKTWENQGGMVDINPDTGELVGDDLLFDVVAVDPKTAWVIGIDGIVKLTVDGGKTWKRVGVGAPKVQLFCIEFDGKNTLVIGGKGVCVFSTDRGRTWQTAEFEPSITYSWIYDVEHMGSDRFISCGEEGAIYLKHSRRAWQRIAY